MSDTCRHCDSSATRSRDGEDYCEEHYWASFFLYVPSGGRKMPLGGWAWASKCPDGVDPRSEDNPYVFTYEETLGEAYDEIKERVPDWDDTWIRVGVIDGYEWPNVDLDLDGDSHDEVLEDPEQIGFEKSKIGVIGTSGGVHLDVIVEDTVESFGARKVAGIDYQGTVRGVGLGVAGDPFHNSEGYEFKNAGEPVDALHDLTTNPGAAVNYRGEPLFRPIRDDEDGGEGHGRADLECDHPVSAEQVVPGFSAGQQGEHPIHGSSTGSNFRVDEGGDTWACWSGRHDHQLPPGTHNVTGNAYHYIAMEEGILECGEWVASDEAYAGRQAEIADACRRRGIPMPLHIEQHAEKPATLGIKHVRSKVRSTAGQEKLDNLALMRTMSNVASEIGSPIDGAKMYHSPQGTRKTVQAVAGAAEHPRLLIGGNKDEYRDTVLWAAEEYGVSVHKIVPFSEHWLASDESPVRDEVVSLIKQSVDARFIKQKFGHLVPDDHVDPFDEQFNGPITADLVVGSPGHENVAAFRSIEFEDGAVHRDVVLDDVSPVDQLDENAFTLDSASNELNQLIRFIPEIESRGITELLRSPDDAERVGRIARGVPGGDEDEEDLEFDAGDVWGALDAAPVQEDDAIVVDIVEAVLENEDVTGKSIRRLKAACGVEQRGVSTVRWADDRGRTVISWVSSPHLSDHDVAVLGATHEPGVTEQWFRDTGHYNPEHVDLCPDWRATRRAQGYLVIQLSDIRNSRSGLKRGSRWYGEDDLEYKAKRTRAWTDAIKAAEGERPWIVDSYGMKRYYEEEGTLEDEDIVIHYGRERSNNTAMRKNVGFVPGPTYYGDQWIGLRGAYAGEHVEVVHPEGKGERAYCESELGQELMTFQIQAAMDQAIGRFGRDTDDLTPVYVDSDEIPGGWPTVDATDHVVHYTESERAAHRAIVDGAETLEEIAGAVGVTRQQAGNLARSLEAEGVVEVGEFELEHGRHRISENTDVHLNTYELSEIPRMVPFSADGAELDAGDGKTVPTGLGGRSPGARTGRRSRDNGPPEPDTKQVDLTGWAD